MNGTIGRPNFAARLILACALMLALLGPAWAVSPEVVDLLKSKSMNDKAKAVEILAKDEAPESATILALLQEGELYLQDSTGALVGAKADGDTLSLKDPATGTSLGSAAKSELTKIGTNNAIRTQLKAIVSGRNLTSPDLTLRQEAAANLLAQVDQLDQNFLAKRLTEEPDAGIRSKLQVALDLKRLQTGGTEAQAAASSLAGNLDPSVRTALTAELEKTTDPELKKILSKALADLEGRIKFYGFLETCFFGMSLGSVLVLAAIGLAITFGVMGVINMAHGELMMLGADTTYVIQQVMPNSPGISIIVAIPSAFLVAGLVGIVIERGIIRFLYGRPLETLLATFGVSLVLQQSVRSIFSPLNRSVTTPEWMSGSLQINPVLSLTWNRLYIIIFCLMAFAALFAVLRRTRLGLEVRAVSQNRAMARAMGTKASLIDALTFGLGSGIAGIAGVALSQLTNVGPNLGQTYIIDSFMVVVFGGVGNLWGTMLAGLSLGVVNKVLEPVSGAVLAKIFVLIFIILFIQKRPTGLFPQKGRAVED